MKICLAASSHKPYLAKEVKASRYMLESFFYMDEWQIPILTSADLFLLDSGAFTFLAGGGTVDWDAYIERYISFIQQNNVRHFFELDIDAVIGYEKVVAYRKQIEARTGKPCIPVWHRSRGKDEYVRLCDEYDYIAIGGFAIKDIKRTEYPYIHTLLDIAAKRGTKVHGLGFTPANVMDYGFYSVDSSAWTSGSRFASFYLFRNGTMKIYQKPAGKRLKDYKKLDAHNLQQWLLFQKYADKE